MSTSIARDHLALVASGDPSQRGAPGRVLIVTHQGAHRPAGHQVKWQPGESGGQARERADLVAEVPTGELHQWEADQNLDREIKAALDALDTLKQAVIAHMLLNNGTGHMRQILHNRCSGGLQRRDPTLYLLELTLNTILTNLKPLEVFKNEIFRVVSHKHLSNQRPMVWVPV